MMPFKAIDLWKSMPQYLKDLNVYTFSKSIKFSHSQSNMLNKVEASTAQEKLYIEVGKEIVIYGRLYSKWSFAIISWSGLYLFNL